MIIPLVKSLRELKLNSFLQKLNYDSWEESRTLLREACKKKERSFTFEVSSTTVAV